MGGLNPQTLPLATPLISSIIIIIINSSLSSVAESSRVHLQPTKEISTASEPSRELCQLESERITHQYRRRRPLCAEALPGPNALVGQTRRRRLVLGAIVH